MGVYAVPTGNAGSQDFSIRWPGQLVEVGPLPDSDHGSILVFDPGDPRRLTRRQLNGELGWPLGRFEPWQVDLARADARETPTALRARWRVGAGGLVSGDAQALPEDWIAEGVSDRTQFFRGLVLQRATASSPVTVDVRFRPVPDSGFSQTDPLLASEIVASQRWYLEYGVVSIEIGGPDWKGAGAVADATNPYSWTPQTSAQAGLATLLDGLAAGTITDLRLVVRWAKPATYVTTNIGAADAGFGKVANWRVNIVEVLVQPPNPPPPGPQSPIPFNDGITYTLRYGETAEFGNTVQITRGGAVPGGLGSHTHSRRSNPETLNASQFARIELSLNSVLSGAGLVILRAEWEEVL